MRRCWLGVKRREGFRAEKDGDVEKPAFGESEIGEECLKEGTRRIN